MNPEVRIAVSVDPGDEFSESDTPGYIMLSMFGTALVYLVFNSYLYG
jgi:hypothetical protein